MITPDYLQKCTDEIQRIAETLEYNLIGRITSRLVKRLERGESAEMGRTSLKEIDRLKDAGLVVEDCQSEIERQSKGLFRKIIDVIVNAFHKTIEPDDYSVGQTMGQTEVSPDGKPISALVKQVAEMNIERTNGTARNLTRTTAIDCGNKFIEKCDEAFTLINTGAMSRDEAITKAIKELSAQGIDTIEYPSGHKDKLSVALTRAVRTGVAQMMGDVTLKRMEEEDLDIIVVSSHLGARCYGDDCRNHAKWQGKFYTRTGRNPQYPNFFDTVNGTGYGTLLGLCGVNCRHTFRPSDGKYNPFEEYDSEENKKAYDDSQKARAMERKIRALKGEHKVFKEAIASSTIPEDKAKYQEQADKLLENIRQRMKEYVAFCKEIGIPPQYQNLEIY